MTIAQQVGRVAASIETATKAREFINLARCVMLARGSPMMAGQLAQEARLKIAAGIFASPDRVYDLPPDGAAFAKAAAAFGTTTDSTWAAPLAEYQSLANAFLESLRNFGAFDKMLPSMRRVPMRTRVGASTSGITGTTVGQAQAKPISKLTLTGDTVDEQKAVAILVVTQELARFGDAVAGNLFAAELSNAVAVETDAAFVSVLTASAPTVGSSGVTAEHVRNDLRFLLASITTSARSQLFLLTTSAIAKVLAVLHDNTGSAAFENVTYRGGNIGGIEVVVSDGVSSGVMLLVDAQQVAAASETINLESSEHAPVQLDSSPDSPPTGNTNLVSLWQMNKLGLKATRYFGATKLTTTGVAVITGATPTGDSPGP